MMEDENKLKLSEKDAEQFLHALANPPPLNDKFKQAFEEYMKTTQELGI